MIAMRLDAAKATVEAACRRSYCDTAALVGGRLIEQ